MSLTPVSEALRRILSGAAPERAELVLLDECDGRVLAAPLAARRDQPPADMSAMDGYAVRQSSLASLPATLRVVGEAAAGHPLDRPVGEMEAARIFTGAPIPEAADTIVIQENCLRIGDTITVAEPQPALRFVRRQGMDFSAGTSLLRAGHRLRPADVSLAAAMGHGEAPCWRRPLVAILSTGDELVRAGDPAGPGQIVASNVYGVAAMARRGGADCLDLGIVRDTPAALAQAIEAAAKSGADILVTLGGASVGDHDLVAPALESAGATFDFWKIAMRPGKPLICARMNGMRIIGLPGNPVSALVCTRLFLMPLIAALSGGDVEVFTRRHDAVLGRDLPANDQREDYLRATLEKRESTLVALPFERQDSGMLATLARADILLVRPPHAPPTKAGNPCEFLYLHEFSGVGAP